MPFHKKTYNFGNLIVCFKIKFPAKLEAKAMGLLSEALQITASKDAKKTQDKDVAETCQLKEFQEHHKNTHHTGGVEGNESGEEEEDDGSQGQRVGCQAQ